MLHEVLTLVTATALLLGSPGPAPLALAATGASVGIRSGLPFLAGILLGLFVAAMGAAASLSFILEVNPVVKRGVQLIGSAYIVYVAYKISSGSVQINGSVGSLLVPNFNDGFFLNLFNPKAWAAFFALFSQFSISASSQSLSLILTGAVSFSVAVVVDFVWLALGGAIGPLFRQPRPARIMRLCFSIALLMVVVWALLQ